MHCCQRIAERGNVNVLSDVATAAMLAAGAADGAAWMVRTNVRAMKDDALVTALNQRLQRTLESISTGKQQVVNIVGGRT
jgi:formiminotetrahydrofolate cyclodeaminase